jgi:hypothetical protein
MRSIFTGLVAASLLSAPVHAAGWQGADQTRSGAFLGARLRLALGGTGRSRPRAALAITPAQSRFTNGMIHTAIGEGIAVNLGSSRNPTLTIAGVRADAALGLQREAKVDPGDKLGLSAGAGIAIGVGAVLIAAGVYYVLATHCDDDADEC